MNFSDLKPSLGSSSRFTVERPIWQLSFNCPVCGFRTGIDVTNIAPFDHVWTMRPDPLHLFDDLRADDRIEVQMERIWNRVTIEPSMQQLPHGRKSCPAHFSVINGELQGH